MNDDLRLTLAAIVGVIVMLVFMRAVGGVHDRLTSVREAHIGFSAHGGQAIGHAICRRSRHRRPGSTSAASSSSARR